MPSSTRGSCTKKQTLFRSRLVRAIWPAKCGRCWIDNPLCPGSELPPVLTETLPDIYNKLMTCLRRQDYSAGVEVSFISKPLITRGCEQHNGDSAERLLSLSAVLKRRSISLIFLSTILDLTKVRRSHAKPSECFHFFGECSENLSI